MLKKTVRGVGATSSKGRVCVVFGFYMNARRGHGQCPAGRQTLYAALSLHAARTYYCTGGGGLFSRIGRPSTAAGF